ncbi:MAG: hypothetical protein DMF67_14095 [Acidobacteria bacterium]|nr:MAG: hypothetical protein DMF67_14095 [Acidobacteriota bacterium]
MYDTKKTRLEIKKLEDAEREKLIIPATLEDVKKYDPKIKVLVGKIDTTHDIGHVLVLLAILFAFGSEMWELLSDLIKWLQRVLGW